MEKKKMKRFFTLDRRANDGFTLVELIVVIAILAILGGVAVPAYSGYVTKAEYVKDEQLLATVNTAYAAACLENGEDMKSLKSGPVLKLDANKAVETVNPYNDKFFIYYAGNEESAFGVMTSIVYSPSAGMFCDATKAVDMLVGGYYADKESVDAFKNGALGQMGADVILGMVGGTMEGLGVDIAKDALPKALESDAYKAEAAKALGLVDGNADEATAVAAYEKYISDKKDTAMQQYYKEKNIDPQNATQREKSEASKYAQAQTNEMEKNLLAVVGTAKTEEAANGLVELLLSGNAYTTLNGNVKGQNGGDNVTLGISQSALAYALYVSYAGENAPLSGFVTALQGTNEGFNEYLTKTEQVNTDLAGAIGAMNIISGQDSTTIEQTIINGLDDEKLAAALQQILGQ